SQHPLASAIIKKADGYNLPYSDIFVEDFSSITGKGIRGKINNEMYYVGSPALFEEMEAANFNDAIKSDVKTLQEQSKTVMVTGDNHSTVRAIGSHVGVTDIQSELLPQDKLDVIKQLKTDYRHVGMVGDGVNDAPALAASTVGIAMGGAGTDTALETADV